MTEAEVRLNKNSYDLRLLAIDGKYYSINFLGKNKIVTKKEFNILKNQYTFCTDF
jgi:hypothetical protein